jgi:hypothetical protein
MRKILVAMNAVLGAISFAAAAAGADLKPQHAVYAVVRDGKPIGDATYSLASNPDGSWTLESITKGSAGMARLVGLDVREQSTFRWENGQPQGVRYDYKQDAAIKHKQRTIDFDWQAHEAHVRDNGKDFSYAIEPGTIDRSTVAVQLGMLLASGAHDASLSVAQKDHLEQQRFAAQGEESISVPAGTFKAIRVERTDVSGKARSWYAPNLTSLPLRVEQVQGDGSTIVMELRQR